MDKRARYQRSAVRSSDQALHPLGKDTELTKGDKGKKKVTIKEEEDKEPLREKKTIIFEESDEGSDKDGLPPEPRSKDKLPPKPEIKEESKKKPGSAKLSKDNTAEAKKARLEEIK